MNQLTLRPRSGLPGLNQMTEHLRRATPTTLRERIVRYVVDFTVVAALAVVAFTVMFIAGSALFGSGAEAAATAIVPVALAALSVLAVNAAVVVLAAALTSPTMYREIISAMQHRIDAIVGFVQQHVEDFTALIKQSFTRDALGLGFAGTSQDNLTHLVHRGGSPQDAVAPTTTHFGDETIHDTGTFQRDIGIDATKALDDDGINEAIAYLDAHPELDDIRAMFEARTDDDGIPTDGRERVLADSS